MSEYSENKYYLEFGEVSVLLEVFLQIERITFRYDQMIGILSFYGTIVQYSMRFSCFRVSGIFD